MGKSQNGWFKMDNPIQMDDDWEYPHFRKPPLNVSKSQLNHISDRSDFGGQPCVLVFPGPHWHRSFEECPGKKAKVLPLCPEVPEVG